MKRIFACLFLMVAALAFGAGAAERQPLAALAKEPEESAAQTPVAPLYPEGTFVVARLKSVAALEKATEALKEWIHAHPSVESQFGEEWETVKNFDLRKAASDYLDLNPRDFDEFFDGPITMCMGADFKWADDSKMLPVVVEMTTRSGEKAKDFVEMLKSDEGVLEATEDADGVTHLKIAPPETMDDEEPPAPQAKEPQQNTAADTKSSAVPDGEEEPKPMDVYVVTVESRVIVGNSLDYALAARDAAKMSAPNAFWARAGGADLAVWLDPRPLVALAKEKLEKRAETSDKMRVDPKIVEDLGLDEIEGVGATLELSPVQLRCDLLYAQNPAGVAKIFTCSPTGLGASPLIPADVEEFSFGRMDLACLWSELRRLVKIAVPSTDAMYEGWQKQIQEGYGVNFEKQVFGALGDRYVFFKKGEAGREGSALYVAVNDAVALQGGLDALFGFFNNGKELFDKEKVGEVTVRRLKSEFQSQSAPPVAYAVTPRWLIVSLGDPTQMQDLIENAGSADAANKIFERPEVKAALGAPNLVAFGHRPLKTLLSDLAAAIIDVRAREDKRAGKPAVAEEVPDFDDVQGSVIGTTESAPGDVHTTLRILTHE